MVTDCFSDGGPTDDSALVGDVDTRNQTHSADNRIYYAGDSVGGRNRAILTWHEVGRYSEQMDLINSFQLILTERSDVIVGDFDVEFRYNRCEWLYGSASSSIAAQAGFDAGDQLNFTDLDVSRTTGMLDLCTTSNVGEPGVWRFQIRNGGVAECGNGAQESGEACDDGNTSDADMCTADCQINVAPVADDQAITMFQADTQSVTLTASDANGTAIAGYSVVSGPTNGTLTGSAPNLVYTPDVT